MKTRQARVRVSTPAAPLGDIQNYAAEGTFAICNQVTHVSVMSPHLQHRIMLTSVAKPNALLCISASGNMRNEYALPRRGQSAAAGVAMTSTSRQFDFRQVRLLCLHPASDRETVKTCDSWGCWTGRPKFEGLRVLFCFYY